MRLHYVSLIAGMSMGCAAGTPQATTTVAATPSSEFASLHARSEAQARRITELEARLGLMEAEARGIRMMLADQAPTARPDVIRIGARHEAANAEPALDMEEAIATPTRTREREHRPLLRSIGEPQVSARASMPSSVPLPVAPPGVPDRLPVVPLPAVASASSPAVAPIAAAPQANAERIRDEYRAALLLVRNRDFDAALSALTEFLSKYPEQEFTDRAMFWRAEAYYAKRDYERALAEFEALGARFPRSEKAADALFKIGMCHQRLGDEQRAQVVFQRLRDQFPASAAARAASKEGA